MPLHRNSKPQDHDCFPDKSSGEALPIDIPTSDISHELQTAYDHFLALIKRTFHGTEGAGKKQRHMSLLSTLFQQIEKKGIRRNGQNDKD